MHLRKRIKIRRRKGFICLRNAVQKLQAAVVFADEDIFTIAIIQAQNMLDVLGCVLGHGSLYHACIHLNTQKQAGCQTGQQFLVNHY